MLPVESEQYACDQHAPRHLEAHPAKDVLSIPGVRMVGAVIKVLSLPQPGAIAGGENALLSEVITSFNT